MYKFKLKKSLILIAIILVAMIGFSTKVDAVTLGKVQNIRQTHASINGFQVTWDKVPNATGYEIIVYENTISQPKSKYPNITGTSISIGGFESNKEYKVRVRACIGTYGNYQYADQYSDEIIVTTAPDKVTGLKTSLTSKGVKLTWNKQQNVSGYEIRRSTSNDGWYTPLKTINTNTNSYIDETAYNGTRYYYSVVAFKNYNNNKYKGMASDLKTQVYVGGTNLSVRSYTDKATLKWNKVSGVKGYKIYRATSKNGTYKHIKTISKASTTTFTDKDKKIKNKNAYYKIRAYQKRSGKEYYGVYSSVQEKSKYEQVVIKKSSANSSKKTITLNWQKVSGVTGYKIYKATSKNGTYKHVKTISKNKTTSYTDKKGIGVGNLYYYKIRVYKKRGSKTEYGQYSAPKKQTTGSRKQQMNKIKLKPELSGVEELDKEYQKIIKKATKGKKTVYDKVQACYKYLEENMKHKDGYNCKHFAGTFAGVMKTLGIRTVYCAEGQTTSGSGWTAHTWVIMEVNDTKYIFDTSIDRHIKDSTKKTSFDRFFKTESERSKKYKLSFYHTYSFPVILSSGKQYVVWF
ncbi:MAG: hypothetical protein HFJ17_02800 [Clostridia bacterium]|nr:hypothetical protein [Clostridia bacterium]